MHPIAPSVPPVPDRLRAALGLMRQRALAPLGGVHLVGDGLAIVHQRPPAHDVVPRGRALWMPRQPLGARGALSPSLGHSLLTRALTYLALQSPEPFDTLPAPYACPPWRDSAAMSQGPASCGAPVQRGAAWIEPGGCFFRPVGQETGWHGDATEVVLGPGREDTSSGAPWGPTAPQQSWAPETRVSRLRAPVRGGVCVTKDRLPLRLPWHLSRLGGLLACQAYEG